MRLGKDLSLRDSWSWRRLRERSKSSKRNRPAKDRKLMKGKVPVDRGRTDSRTNSNQRSITIISRRWTSIVFRDSETLSQVVYFQVMKNLNLIMKT